MTFASSWQDYSFAGQPALSFPTFRQALVGLHDHFIPHERNNYHPHILSQRVLGLFSLLMVAVKFAVLASLAFGPVAPAVASAITTANVFSLTNQSRTEFQVPSLTLNNKLFMAAQAKANDMAAKGYFSHTSPDGRIPWDFITAAGYSYISAGENLAVDFSQAESIEAAWMNSPGHRANILNKTYQEIGIGIASGQFQGHTATFVVQEFGTPTEQQIALQNNPTPVAPAAAPAPVPHAAVPPTAAQQPPAAASAAPVASSNSATPSPTTISPENLALRSAAAASTPTELWLSAPVQIVDTKTEIQTDKMVLTVATAGPVVQVVADYNGQATMFYPKSDTLWQAAVPLSKIYGDANLVVVVSDMAGHSQKADIASFTPTLQSNYQFLGDVKGAAITVLGATFDPKVLEQKFYLLMIAGILACLIAAIAIKRHIQHLSLVANSSFVVVLAALLWMAG